MNRLRSFIRQHALVAFLLLTFGISWTAFLLDQPIVFVFRPSVAGVILFAGRNLRRPETEAIETESKPAVVPV